MSNEGSLKGYERRKKSESYDYLLSVGRKINEKGSQLPDELRISVVYEWTLDRYAKNSKTPAPEEWREMMESIPFTDRSVFLASLGYLSRALISRHENFKGDYRPEEFKTTTVGEVRAMSLAELVALPGISRARAVIIQEAFKGPEVAS